MYEITDSEYYFKVRNFIDNNKNVCHSDIYSYLLSLIEERGTRGIPIFPVSELRGFEINNKKYYFLDDDALIFWHNGTENFLFDCGKSYSHFSLSP